MSHENLFIGISGIIGAGKTTLATKLGAIFDLPVYYEGVIDNIYLADFYGNMAKYSFPLQIYLLNQRFRQHQQIIWFVPNVLLGLHRALWPMASAAGGAGVECRSGKGGVQDRTIYEDSIFAKALMESKQMERRDYETYVSLFSNMANFMRKPTLIVHLDVTPEQSLERIRSRGRNCETGITLEYLQRLHVSYDDFLREISPIIPVLRVNWSQYVGADEMANVIKEEYSKMHNIRYVDFATPKSAKK